MKINGFTKKVLAGFSVFAATVCVLMPMAAQAELPVTFGGLARMSVSVRAGTARGSAQVDQVINSSFSSFSGVRVVLVLSTRKYAIGRDLRGTTVASTTLGAFPARSYFTDVKINGSSRFTKRGKFKVVIVVVDNSNRILSAINFNETLSLRSVSTSPLAGETQLHSLSKSLDLPALSDGAQDMLIER